MNLGLAMQNIFLNWDISLSLVWCYELSALTVFQFHWIAHSIDDTTQVFVVDNVCVHDKLCKNALKTRLKWSKNVTEECDAPWHVVLGLMDTVILLGVDNHHSENPNAGALSPYLISFSDDV